MRTVSMILALTFAASAASAETAKPASAHARVPQQAKRSTPAPKPTPLPKATPPPKATPVTPAAPTIATDPAAPTDTAAAAPTIATDAAAPSPAAMAATDAPAEAPAATTATPAPADADEGDDTVAAEHAVKVPLPAKPPTATALTVEYQRVGRDILKLQDQRGKFDCGNLQQRFKAIKLDTAIATPASRMQLYVTLTELAMKLERMRGIKLDSACLANPLAAGCM